MFVDYVEINVAGGVGGSGAEAWRREMGVARGGPAGGDGGKGGSVYLEADGQIATLLDYRYKNLYRAERGQHGQGKSRTGKDGEDLVLKVPPGTVVKDAVTGELLDELVEPGDRMLAAKGGRGGRGNEAFATPTNRSPRRWEPGEEGQERRIALELKLIADVGLVGQPNAGKSTLLAAVSAATPKIADYPFTTIAPNLGVVQLTDHRTFVMADIPGIIEGAAEGKGLGLRFLRHIERTRTLAVMIPVDSEDPQHEYELLMQELRSHSEELAGKPHCVVITKTDLLPPGESAPKVDAPEAWGAFAISGVARHGLDSFLEALWARVRKEIDFEPEEDERAPTVYRP